MNLDELNMQDVRYVLTKLYPPEVIATEICKLMRTGELQPSSAYFGSYFCIFGQSKIKVRIPENAPDPENVNERTISGSGPSRQGEAGGGMTIDDQALDDIALACHRRSILLFDNMNISAAREWIELGLDRHELLDQFLLFVREEVEERMQRMTGR
jgi:hypothetical protein